MNYFFSFLLLVFLFSCKKKQEQKQHTFYYWKTTLSLDHQEKEALSNAVSPFLYTRFFDVDKRDGKFQPVAVAIKESSFQSTKKIVPVIFITNRTFINIKKDELQFLAKQIHQLIEKKTKDFQFEKSPEIQIDCDWTAGTKDDYFYFLKELEKVSKKEITSTLRLHQVRYKEKMGVPPVSKVYLMCYSTSSPLENSDKNSILDVEILKKYLSNVQNYPIRNMDVALPIYSWGIVTNHLGKHKLINGLNGNDLKVAGLKKIKENEVLVEKDGFYFGFYLNKGFRIKIEEISDDQLLEVIDFLDSKIENFNLIYYQLNSKFVQKHFKIL